MTDTQVLANVFTAMADIPARLSALERVAADILTKLQYFWASLPPALVTVTDAAAACKVSVPTMRRWVKRGEVPSLKVGHTVRVDLSRLHGKDDAMIAMLAADARTHREARNLPS